MFRLILLFVLVAGQGFREIRSKSGLEVRCGFVSINLDGNYYRNLYVRHRGLGGDLADWIELVPVGQGWEVTEISTKYAGGYDIRINAFYNVECECLDWERPVLYSIHQTAPIHGDTGVLETGRVFGFCSNEDQRLKTVSKDVECDEFCEE